MSKAVGKVFGGGGSPGMLGTGRFKGTKVGVDESGFRKQLAGAGPQAQLKEKQLKQTARLEETAEGKRPSLAEAQLKAATDRSLKQQMAAAQTQRGGSAASRQRSLAKGIQASRRDVAEQASQAKLQEQQQAEQALAQQLTAQKWKVSI